MTDVTEARELDPARDAVRLLRPRVDDPLEQCADDTEDRHELVVRRWAAWLAS